MRTESWTVLHIILAACSAEAFSLTRCLHRKLRQRMPQSPMTSLFAVEPFNEGNSAVVELSLSKPLGIMLEEVEEGSASGVYVKEVMDSGSAAEYAIQIVGAKLSTVQGEDMTTSTFEAAMDTIINAPEMVEIKFLLPQTVVSSDYVVGDTVLILAQQDGKDDIEINAKVGENLRQVLLQNGFEVYQGLKQTLGNCGGGGQCTFCAVDFVESDGWELRSDYEDTKLAKFPQSRLSCLNNIQGPATIRKTKR